MRNIGHTDFIVLCGVSDTQDWGGYRICADGVYIKIPDASVYLTREEYAAITEHPGDPSEPVLSFPCTLDDLRTFLDDQATGITIEDEDVAYKRHAAGGDKVGDTPGGVEIVPLGDGGVEQPATVRHKLKNRIHALDAEIGLAKSRAIDGDDISSVWGELEKMAKKTEGVLVGQAPGEGLQYKGKNYYQNDELDVFTRKALADRMRRDKTR